MNGDSPEALFQRTLEMDARLAHLLVAGGIVTLEELAYVPISELLAVRGLTALDAQHFRQRARDCLLRDGDLDGDAEATEA